MLSVLPFPVADMIQYMNIAFIVIIALCAIKGFFRGTMKSVYYLAASIIVFGIGWIAMDPLFDFLMNFNLSFTGQSINGIELTTPIDLISKMITEENPEYAFLFTEGSYSLDVVKGVLAIAFRMVYFLLLVLLSFTLFFFMFGFVWLIVRKPLRRAFCKPKKIKKNGKPKYKKSFVSRLGGLGIGAFKGLMYTLLIGFMLAGMASISNSVQDIMDTSTEEMALVCTEEGFTLVELSTGEKNQDEENPLAEYEEIFEFFQGYRKTVPGVVFGSVKFGKDKTTLDEYMFDSIFSIKTEKVNLKLRNELRKVAKAFSNEAVQSLMSDGFEMNKLFELESDDLKELVDTLSSLDFIQVVMPVGVEFITYSSALEEMLGDGYEDIQDLLEENFEELIDLNYCNEAKKLGYIFVDIIDLLGENSNDLENLDFFGFNQETLNSIFENLDELELLEIIAPVTITYLLNSDSIKEAIEEAGFTLEDLGLTEDVDYVQELMNLPVIYEKVVDLGIKMVDGKVDLSEINPDKVEALVETLFDSVIISNAVPVIATTITTSYLPDDYADIFTKEELDGVEWEDEFSPLLTAAAVLIKSGLLDSEDPIETLTNMEDEDFSELGKYLSQSSVLTNNLNEILEVLMESLSFEDISFTGLEEEKGERWNETEIVSLFKAVKVILNSEIISSEDPVEAIKALDDTTIDDLAKYLSQSKYITKNLNAIVELAFSNIDMGDVELEGLDPEKGEFWDETELSSLFGALKTIVDTGVVTSEDPVESFKDIKDSDIDLLAYDLSNSKFFVKNLNGIMKYVIENMSEDITLETLDSQQGEEWTELEIKSIFKAVKVIVDAGLLGSDDIMTSLKELQTETIENLAINLSSSVFMKKNINSLIDTFMSELDFELVRLEKDEWTSNEIYSLFKSINTIANISTSGNITVEDFLHVSDEDLNILLESKLIKESMKKLLVEKSVSGEDLEMLRGVYEDGKDVNGVEVYDWNDEELSVISNVSNGVLSFTPNAEALEYIVYKNGMYFMATESTANINLNEVEGYTYSQDDQFSVKVIIEKGELRKIFNAISVLDVEDIETFSIDLRKIVTEKDTILSSYILTETLISEIRLQDRDNAGGSLFIPSELKEGGNGEWRGEEGELISLINGLDIALEISTSEEPVPADNIDTGKVTFKKIIDNQDIMFKSGILTATIVAEIQELGEDGILTIPTEYQNSDITLWKNTATTKGELALFFDGLEYVVELPEQGFDVDTETIHIKDLIVYEDEIFKSSVLTATITKQILDLEGTLTIPTEYKLTDNSWETGYSKWKNEYTNNVVTYRGELSLILEATDLIIGITSSPDEVSISSLSEKLDTIHIEDIIENKDDILLSYVLTATIADKVIDLSSNGLDVPTQYRDSYEPWANTYDENHNVLIEGEVSKLLDAVYLSLGLNDNTQTSIEAINVDNMDLSNITKDENRDQLLYSAVYTETLKNKIISFSTDGSGAIHLPNNYNQLVSNNYVVWENTYNNDGTLLKHGELSYILKALDLLKGTASITDLSGLDYHSLFVTESQDEILKSKVISETVICKIVEDNQDNLSIPSNKGLDNYDDRSAWFNEYNENEVIVKRNELANTLSALDKMLLDNQKNDLLNVDLYETLDNMLGLFKSTEDKKVLLKSYIVAETLKDNIYNIKAIKDEDNDYIKASFERYYGTGCDTTESSYWYEIDNNGEAVQKELWNVLTGASLLLNGDSLTDENQEFTLNTLLSNSQMIPIYNNVFEVTDSKIDVMLESIILEEIFAKLANDLFNDKLSAFVEAPDEGFNWHRKDVLGTTNEYDLRSFLESFYIIQQYIDVSNIASSYIGLLTLSDDKINDLGAGMIISRTFRASIAKMFNTIFAGPYALKASTNNSMTPWSEVMFNQNDYVSTLSRKDAHDNFVNTYKAICSEMNQ